MKQRLLTALIGGAAAIGWLFTMYTPAFAIIFTVFALIGEYEILKVFKVKNYAFKALCYITTAGILLYAEYSDKIHIPFFPVATAILLLSLIIMVLDFEKLRFEQVASSLLYAVIISVSFSCIIHFRDLYITSPTVFCKNDGIFFIIYSFFCSWMTDGCALFAGRAFGKHKLCEKVSPKKTVEGAIGGLIGNCLFCVALYFVFLKKFNLSPSIKLWQVIVAAFVLGVLSIFGDLSASTVKRHCGIKDFGNLLPGHGGVMDRFDSCLFVFPALYALIINIVY